MGQAAAAEVMCGEDVGSMVLHMEREHLMSQARRSSYEYMTKAQLLERFKDRNAVENMIARKYASGQWREHPDAPGCEALHEFWIQNRT